MRERNYLFADTDWHSVDQHQRQAMMTEVNGIDSDQLLNTSPEDLCAYFEEKYRVNVPTLLADEIVVEQIEIKIDVSQDQDRIISNRSQPFYVNGTEVKVEIPYYGDNEAFGVRPTRCIYDTQGIVQNGVLILTFSGTELQCEQLRNRIDQALATIKANLENLRRDAQGLNDGLRSIARDAIERRHNKLLADRNLVGSLGFRIKERSGESRTFVTPQVRRKITPQMPAASSTPFKPQHALSDPDYEHILKVIQGMGHVMEHSPSAFTAIDEESLRFHYLVQLNGHYEGNATGETFNYGGKTDILIRVDGKNIFIAECKFWRGSKVFLETIDQVLGYACWHDIKVAIIIFNRNKDFQKCSLLYRML